jgi:hypothetical protein
MLGVEPSISCPGSMTDSPGIGCAESMMLERISRGMSFGTAGREYIVVPEDPARESLPEAAVDAISLFPTSRRVLDRP